MIGKRKTSHKGKSVAVRVAHYALLACLCVLTSCRAEPPKDEYKFIEYLELQGTCREDHVRDVSNYIGSLVHWHNMTKSRHDVYGSVTLAHKSPKNFQAEKFIADVLEKTKTPYKYFPPFSVDFSNLTVEQVASNNFILKGISHHLDGKDDDSGPRYETTCQLTVTKRLNYLPPAGDRQ